MRALSQGLSERLLMMQPLSGRILVALPLRDELSERLLVMYAGLGILQKRSHNACRVNFETCRLSFSFSTATNLQPRKHHSNSFDNSQSNAQIGPIHNGNFERFGKIQFARFFFF